MGGEDILIAHKKDARKRPLLYEAILGSDTKREESDTTISENIADFNKRGQAGASGGGKKKKIKTICHC